MSGTGSRSTYEEKLERLQAYCREHDQRLTVQKRKMLEVLLEQEEHPSADDIFEDVRERVPGISRATVYRILEMLTDAKLVRKVYHPEDQYRYDARTSHHHHLVCTSCERVMDVELKDTSPPELPDERADQFQVEDYSIYFQGVCTDCRETESAEASVAE